MECFALSFLYQECVKIENKKQSYIRVVVTQQPKPN